MMGVDSEIFWHALGFTVKQALLSSALSVVVGVLASPGYSRLGKNQRWARWILLFPNLMSPVLVILALLLFFKSFPFGLSGILLGHVFLNAGLATVWIGSAWQEIEVKWAPVNFVLGGDTLFFFRRAVLPQIIPSILSTFAVIFAFCLSSFAIPLVLGGGPQSSTLEVLIYERIQTAGDIHSALYLGLVQVILEIVVFVILIRTLKDKTAVVKRPLMPVEALPLAYPFVIIVLLFCLLPLLKLFSSALPEVFHLGAVTAPFISSLRVSTSVAILVGGLVFIALSLCLGWGAKPFIIRMPGVSGVAIGLSGLLILNTLPWQNILVFVLVLTYGHFCVVLFPILRLVWPKLSSVRQRYEGVLSQLGSSKLFGLRSIYFPLEKKVLLSASLLGALWSLGEFSVSRILSGEFVTLPLLISGLISSYKLEMASGVSLVLFMATFMTLMLIEGFAHVVD